MARSLDLHARPKETQTMTTTDTFQRPHCYTNRASARPRYCQQALIVLQPSRYKATLHNLINQGINAGLIALIGCSIAAALAFGAPMPAAGTQAAMPLDQPVFPASPYQPRVQCLVGNVNAPVRQGWG
jgi:hypothetical protein